MSVQVLFASPEVIARSRSQSLTRSPAWDQIGLWLFVCPEVIAGSRKAKGPAHGGSGMISATRLHQLVGLIQAGREARFYDWPEWQAVREEVLRLDKRECVLCRQRRHRYRPAKIVHHVKHLRDRPDLALSVTDPDTGERQLVSVCKKCHEELHPESQRQFRQRCPPLTPERWD